LLTREPVADRIGSVVVALEQQVQLLCVVAADELAGRAALLALRGRVRQRFLRLGSRQARRGLRRVEHLMTNASAI
jgi:hypothetical protein